MATYVKGNPVANATSYELLEKVGSAYNSLKTGSAINFDVSALNLAAGNHTLVVKAKADGYEDSDYSNEVVYAVAAADVFRGKGSYDLFSVANVGSIPKLNANTLTGWTTAVGQVPSDFKIAGVRLAVHPSNGTSGQTFEKCSKVKVALYAFDVDDMVQPKGLSATDDNRKVQNKTYTIVAEKTVDVNLALDTTHLVDLVFDTPYVNTDNKFLVMAYITDTVNAKVINNSKKTWAVVNDNEEDTKYTADSGFYNWYFNNGILSFDWAQFKAASGDGETYSVAYTLFNKTPV